MIELKVFKINNRKFNSMSHAQIVFFRTAYIKRPSYSKRLGEKEEIQKRKKEKKTKLQLILEFKNLPLDLIIFFLLSI